MGRLADKKRIKWDRKLINGALSILDIKPDELDAGFVAQKRYRRYIAAEKPHGT